MLQDSGARMEFPSGAVRDVSFGKGRMDLIDITCASMLIGGDPILDQINSFVHMKDADYLLTAMQMFMEGVYGGTYTGLIEVSKQFEEGAQKYSPNNWRKGMNLHCYIDSALRHYMKYLRGDKDEPHDRAFVWNLMCAYWTLNNRPDLDDIDVGDYLVHE